jgi:hypothetical protein
MVPHESARGASFMGCARYHLRDKAAETSERVGWTHIVNMRGVKDPEKAFRWMAFSAMAANEEKERTGATGRRIERPVWSQSFSWHPQQSPTKEQMIEAARSWMSAFDLDDHQAVIVQHTDTPHAHCHLILNLLNPQTNKVAELGYSKLKSSKWAEQYERENGGIICKQREDNNAKREQGEYVRYQEPEIDLKIDFRTQVTQMYHAADTGAAFQSALVAGGLTLAQGGKRLVLIDAEGKAHSLWRQIDGVKAAQIKSKLADLELPSVEEALAQQKDSFQKARSEETSRAPSEEEEKKDRQEESSQAPTGQQEEKYFDRDAYEQLWQDAVIESAIKTGAAKTGEERSGSSKNATDTHLQPSPEELNPEQDPRAEQLSIFYSESHRRRQELAARLDAEHGESVRKLKSESERLDNLLRNSGPVRRWWLWLRGQIPRNADERLRTMRGELQRVEASKDDARKTLEDQIAQDRAALELRHGEGQPPPTQPYSSSFDRWKREYAQSQQESDLEEDLGPTLGW